MGPGQERRFFEGAGGRAGGGCRGDVAHRLLAHAELPVVLFGAGEAAYMLGAGVLLVLGAGRWLALALTPGVVASAVFLGLGRPAYLEHVTWIGMAATPVLAVGLAVVFTKRTSPSLGRPWSGVEVLRAAPSAWYGLAAAGLLTFPSPPASMGTAASTAAPCSAPFRSR